MIFLGKKLQFLLGRERIHAATSFQYLQDLVLKEPDTQQSVVYVLTEKYWLSFINFPGKEAGAAGVNCVDLQSYSCDLGVRWCFFFPPICSLQAKLG